MAFHDVSKLIDILYLPYHGSGILLGHFICKSYVAYLVSLRESEACSTPESNAALQQTRSLICLLVLLVCTYRVQSVVVYNPWVRYTMSPYASAALEIFISVWMRYGSSN